MSNTNNDKKSFTDNIKNIIGDKIGDSITDKISEELGVDISKITGKGTNKNEPKASTTSSSNNSNSTTTPSINIDQNVAKIKETLDKNEAIAKTLLKNTDKLEEYLQKLENKLKTVPVVGSSLAYVPTLISLVRNYIKKEYSEVPIGTLLSIVAALLYVLSPIDILPDAIPGIGYLDDAFVVTACLSLIRTDLEDYTSWRKKKGLEVANLPDYNKINKDNEKVGKIASTLFKSVNNKSIDKFTTKIQNKKDTDTKDE